MRRNDRVKKRWIVCGVLSLLLLACALLPFLHKNQSWQAEEDAVWSEEQAGEKLLEQNWTLSRGIYRVTVDYQTDKTLHYISGRSAEHPERIGCDEILLERKKDAESFLVWISGKTEDFQVYARYEGYGEFAISRVQIEELTMGKVHDLVLALFGSGLLFALTWFCGNMAQLWREDREQFWVNLALGSTILLISIPIFRPNLIEGHDSGFHFMRIEGLWRALTAGKFPVRIQPFWLNDYGYPVSVFYGDILLYLPSLLRPLGFSVQAVYEIFEFAVNGAAVLATYYCLHQMTRDRRIAAFGSALYAGSLYRFANVYVRNAVGEYCAMIFLPVVVYGFWCILSGEKDEKKKWLPLLVGFSGLIQTHVISCEFAGLFSVALCLIFIRRVFQKERFLALVKAAVGTVLVNLWFLVPFADYMLREHVAANTVQQKDSFLECTISFGQLFAPFVRWNASPNAIPARLGLGLLLGALLLAAVLLRSVIGHRKERCFRLAGFAGVCMGFAVAALLMTTSLVPWVELKQTALFMLTMIQYPWRLMGFATVFLICGICSAILYLRQSMGKRAALIGMAVVTAGTVLSTGYTMATFLQDKESVCCYEERDATYYVSGGEYLPSDVELSDEAFQSREPKGEGIQISAWEKGCLEMQVTCENAEENENLLNMPLLLYRGYVAYDTETGEQFAMMRTDSGMTAVVLPAGYAGTVEMRFREPWYWRVSELVSLLALAGIIGGAWKRKRKERKRKENENR